MRQHFLKPTLLALSALAMSGLVPALAGAQDRQDDHPARADEHRDDQHKQTDHKQTDHKQTGDPAEGYRHDHPNSSARCHDGFFTTTSDRNRACTKHGGIDVWLRT